MERASGMNFLLKRFRLLGLVLLFCLFSASVYGETMYVADILKLTLRTGPSIENKIISVIESGQMMEVIKFGDEWSQVQLPNGKEGWVLSRYLTTNETHNIKLERLEAKHKNLMVQAAELLEENNRLQAENKRFSTESKAENKRFSTESKANQKQFVQTQADYEALKAEAAEFITLKTNYKRAASQLAEQTAKAKQLEEELSSLEMNTYIKWFLAGSGVLIVGFLIGFSTKRQRRRPALV
jgi:SH3 domain protein